MCGDRARSMDNYRRLSEEPLILGRMDDELSGADARTWFGAATITLTVILLILAIVGRLAHQHRAILKSGVWWRMAKIRIYSTVSSVRAHMQHHTEGLKLPEVEVGSASPTGSPRARRSISRKEYIFILFSST